MAGLIKHRNSLGIAIAVFGLLPGVAGADLYYSASIQKTEDPEPALFYYLNAKCESVSGESSQDSDKKLLEKQLGAQCEAGRGLARLEKGTYPEYLCRTNLYHSYQVFVFPDKNECTNNLKKEALLQQDYEYLCEHGEGKYCHRVALQRLARQKVTRQVFDGGDEWLQKGCDAGYQRSCKMIDSRKSGIARAQKIRRMLLFGYWRSRCVRDNEGGSERINIDFRPIVRNYGSGYRVEYQDADCRKAMSATRRLMSLRVVGPVAIELNTQRIAHYLSKETVLESLVALSEEQVNMYNQTSKWGLSDWKIMEWKSRPFEPGMEHAIERFRRKGSRLVFESGLGNYFLNTHSKPRILKIIRDPDGRPNRPQLVKAFMDRKPRNIKNRSVASEDAENDFIEDLDVGDNQPD